MDPINQNDKNKKELSSQYQDILDRYAEDLAKKATPEVAKPEEVTPPEPIKLEEAISPTVSVPPTPPILPPTQEEMASLLSAEPEDNVPPVNNLFKYFFYLSLLTFVGVCVAIGYNLYSKISQPNNNSLTKDTIPTVTSTVSAPTAVPTISGPTCNLNDKNYDVGQSFASADGCNTCTCNTDLTIICTEKACEASPSIKLTPTKSATTSAVIKDITYKNTKLSFSLTLPASWSGKYTVVEGSNNVQFLMKDATINKALIFAITSMTDTGWADAQSTPHGTLIIRNSVTKRVFIEDIALENPFTDSTKASSFSQMTGDVNSIISSFKLAQ